MKTISPSTLFSRLGQYLAIVILLSGSSCTQAENDSYKVAQSAIDPQYQNQVFWIKAAGTPAQLNEWTYYFYDPTISSKARLVKIVNGRVDRVQPAEFKSAANESLVFDPTLNKVSAEQALLKAKAYSNEKQIQYDTVKMQLRRPSAGAAPAWRIELYQGSRFAGTVRLNESDGSVVSYQPTQTKTSGVDGFARDVESTFRGVGADLEEFFTGERTVDK